MNQGTTDNQTGTRGITRPRHWQSSSCSHLPQLGLSQEVPQFLAVLFWHRAPSSRRWNHFSVCPGPGLMPHAWAFGFCLEATGYSCSTNEAGSPFPCILWCGGCPLSATTNRTGMKELTGSTWPPLLKEVWRGWKPKRHGQALSSRAGILNSDLRRSVKQVTGS